MLSELSKVFYVQRKLCPSFAFGVGCSRSQGKALDVVPKALSWSLSKSAVLENVSLSDTEV